MKCPNCGADEAKAVRTIRADAEGAAQERVCRACGAKHVTVVMRPQVPEGTSVYEVARMMREGELDAPTAERTAIPGSSPLD